MKPRMRKTLTDVRGLIAEHGWIQGKMFDNEHGYCLTGACMAVAGFPSNHCTNVFRLLVEQIPGGPKVLHSELPYSAYLMSFNDSPGRTKEEALTLIDKALKET